MTPAERKRFDAKNAAKNKAKDIADKKKKYLAKQKKIKERNQEEEGKAYGKSRGKVQKAIREKQREGLDYKERKTLRKKLSERESYGSMEGGTYRSPSDIMRGQGAEPPMTYSKGDKPVEKFVPTSKSNTSDARLKKFMDQKQVQDDFVFPKKTLSPLEKARKASREKTNKRTGSGKTTKRPSDDVIMGMPTMKKGGKTTMKAQKYNMGGMAAKTPMSDDKEMSMLRKKKKRPSMGMPAMKKGGKVRGCGMATQGNRKAKMVTMKGA